jgi:hypothetical protein
MRLRLAIVVIAAVAAAPVLAADDIYNIMKPEPGARSATSEPWLAPKYESPRGTIQRPVSPRPPRVETRRIPDVPPPIVVPQTGRSLPNIPPVVPGAGVGGRETSQDRATRCTHQAGMYGAQAGDRSSYITTCVNQ